MNDSQIVKDDTIVDVTAPINYNVKNPVVKLMQAMEDASFFAEERGEYVTDSLQYLFPYSHLDLYGPAGTDHAVLDPVQQDNKTDFQKQNIKDFILTDTFLVRGWASVGNWTGPFLKVSYRGDRDSLLSVVSGHKLDAFIYLWIKIQGQAVSAPIKVFYNTDTNRYDIELWGYPQPDFSEQLSDKGKNSLANGWLVARPDLLKGTVNDFKRDGLDNLTMYQVAPDNSMHPINPLQIELAWGDHTKTYWDSRHGANYHYSFNMLLRGWNNYMQVGVSESPHGGTGFLHYRNLMSNYKSYSNFSELGRQLEPWMFDANGEKGHNEEEKFLSVDYIDLHILKPECAIGIHRHRDNQEIFFLLSGKALMVMGDWYQFPNRERAFEIRTLLPGSFTLLKAGQLHALVNALDVDASLLMFGGYD